MNIEELRDRLVTAAKLTCTAAEWTHLTATIVQAIDGLDYLQAKLISARSALSDIETRSNQELEK